MAKVRLPKPRILSISVPALIVLVVMTWLAGTLLRGQPLWLVWTVRGLVLALGSLAIVLVLKLFKGSGAPAARVEPDAVDGLIEQATKRLNAIGMRGRSALARMPIVLVLGPRGSAKTTFVLQSDLDADLLAGNAHSAGVATPTDAVNLWYRDGQVLVEAAGQLTVEPARWARLVEKLKPRQWIPALLGRSQAPRVAVVCFSVDDLTGPASGDSYLGAARTLRARLTELAEGIGIRLPVYVVFTKSDRVPHFEEFARNLTEAEVHEVLGATLRSSGEAAPGSYAERETERLSRAFEDLFTGLAERRLEVVGRAGTTVGNGPAYEFPREFRKVSKPVIQFLVELFRPSQLRVSPFLRGFYFTGVRPVVARDDALEPAQAQMYGSPAAAGATQMFRLNTLEMQAARPAASARSQERRVPQWVFLDRILQRVVLMDRVAMGITTSGLGLSVLRRASMAAGIAVFLLFAAATFIAYLNDRALQRETRAALDRVGDVTASPVILPSTEQLQRLDSLRIVTERLSRYENEGRPLRSKLFMYSGGDLYDLTRQAYFGLFRPLLFESAFEGLKSDLQQLPPEPTSEQFEQIYRSLKAYVEITDPAYHDSASAEFFGPVLTERWVVRRGAPPGESRELLQRQFAFYGAELPYGSPFTVEGSDPNLTNRGRSFLSANTNEDSFYARLVGQWSHLAAGRIEVDRPETQGFFQAGAEVPGAYTRTAWDSVHASLANTAQTFGMHVVGPTFFESLDLGTLPQRLQARYEESYREAWLGYLAEVQLQRRDQAQAQAWLTQLSASRSPLMQLFSYVDSQTKVEAPQVQTAFAALRVMVAADSLGQMVLQKPGQDYLFQVQGLAQEVGRLTQDPAQASAAVLGAASQGEAFVGQTEITFPQEPPAARQANSALVALLRSPFSYGRELADQGPGMAANLKAQGFCSRWAPLVFQKFPFRLDATDEVLMADLHTLFNPGSGELNAFIQEVDRSGITPSAAYSTFRTRAQEVASALYENGPAAPGLRIALQVRSSAGIDRVDARVDAQNRSFTATDAERQSFVWDGSRANQASIVVRQGPRQTDLAYAGPWALFRLFSVGGGWQDLGSGRYVVTWPIEGGTLDMDVYFTRVPVLNPDYLRRLACPRQVTR